MTGGPPYAPMAGDEGSELVRHLLSDFLIKGVIVLVALLVLTMGMVVIWRTVGRGGTRDRDR
ncbi:hypothetical protein AB0395_04990 [Streptosporangium sp. NPDC051023]|uniref:hypothetical protein n=1 Tax=Streptosporangium sp. NPDC051023 TaxID=3155410 RepID=UPI0034502CF7